jgi:hypothetical protein
MITNQLLYQLSYSGIVRSQKSSTQYRRLTSIRQSNIFIYQLTNTLFFVEDIMRYLVIVLCLMIILIGCKPKPTEQTPEGVQPDTGFKIPTQEMRTVVKPIETEYPQHQDGIIYGFSKKPDGTDSIWTFKVLKNMRMNSIGIEIPLEVKYEEFIRQEDNFHSDMFPDSAPREVVEIAFSTELDYDQILAFLKTRIGDPEEGSNKENGIAFFSWGHPAGDDFIHVFYSDRTTIYGERHTLQLLHSIPK